MGAATVPLLWLGSGIAKGAAQTQGAQASADMYTLQGQMSRAGAATERQWAKYNAALARGESQRSAAKVERAGEFFVGKLAPAYAASGVEMSGTPMDVMADQIATIEEQKAEVLFAGQQEAITSLYKGDLAAWNKMVNADMNDYMAASTMNANAWRQTGSILGGGLEFYDMGGFNDLFGWGA